MVDHECHNQEIQFLNDTDTIVGCFRKLCIVDDLDNHSYWGGATVFAPNTALWDILPFPYWATDRSLMDIIARIANRNHKYPWVIRGIGNDNLYYSVPITREMPADQLAAILRIPTQKVIDHFGNVVNVTVKDK